MNIYFLVEGDQTERKVYPIWLKYLVPRLVRVNCCDDVVKNHYYLACGGGFPSIIDVHLNNAVTDVNEHGNFDYLILCLDVDDSTPEDLVQLIHKNFQENRIGLVSTQLVIIFQNKCFETWFLGNRKIFKRNPSNQQLRKYITHYNVLEDDPENMPKTDDFKGSTSYFHSDYFRLICRERNCRYSKEHPGLVTENSFLDELVARFQETKHVPSFGRFVLFCEYIHSQISEVA